MFGDVSSQTYGFVVYRVHQHGEHLYLCGCTSCAIIATHRKKKGKKSVHQVQVERYSGNEGTVETKIQS